MTIHHQDHLDRVTAGLSLEWDVFPRAVTSTASISEDAQDARLLRKGKSLKGVAALTHLRRVWVHGVDQSLLHELCMLPNVEVLFMEKVTATELSVLQGAKALRQLSLDGVPAIDHLSWLGGQRTLHALSLKNWPLLRNLAPLAAQTQLQGLALDGGTWTPLQVDSLAPLAGLEKLQCLSLINCEVRDGSLEPLRHLGQLRVLHCGQNFPRDQFLALHAARPNLLCDWFDPSAWNRS